MRTEHRARARGKSLTALAAAAASVALGLVLLLAAIAAPLPAQQSSYRLALPGYRYSFPHDYFNHPDFETEWWYYTGNLEATGGHRFGFELTFFRRAVSRDPKLEGPWSVRDLYLAHLALSDLSDGRFYHQERLDRQGPGLAGVDESAGRIWNGNWQIEWKGSEQLLDAVGANFALRFSLDSEKPPVIHGKDGVSQKAAGRGYGSHYISLTRLDTRGTIQLEGKSYSVSGTAWMDHEFFTNQLAPQQVGWDWISIQLEDHTELMLFRIRRADGTIDPFSAGTYVDAAGAATHLRDSDFAMEPQAQSWKSPANGASYPIDWKIAVPRLGIALEATTRLPSQEMAGNSDSTPAYWEGAIDLRGTRGGKPASGVGYLEMTGYAGQPHL